MRRGFWGLVVVMGCATTPRPADRLVQEDIQERVLEERDALARCTAAERLRDPSSHGKVLLQWRILPSGEPRDVKAASDGPPELLSCLVAVFETIRFRKTTTEAEHIVYPLKY